MKNLSLSKNFPKYLLAAFLTGCLGVCFFSFKASICKLFTLDEALMVMRSHWINLEGLKGPAMALGSEGMTHPPLYEALLALIFRIFGETEFVGRFFGVLSYLAIGLLMLKAVSYLLKDLSKKIQIAGCFLALTLYLVNPLLIQHSMLIDAETGLSALLIAAFVWFFIRSEVYGGSAYLYSRLVLAIIFAVTFFSKEITSFFLLSGILAYRILAREWRKFVMELAIIGGFGVCLIGIGGFLYTFLSGEKLEVFFLKQYGFRTGRIFTSRFFWSVLKNLHVIARWPVYWVSAPFYLPLIACLAWRIVYFFKRKKAELIDFVVLISFAIWTPYFFVKPSIDMMKYQYSSYTWFIAAIAVYAARVYAGFLPDHQSLLKSRREKIAVFLGVLALAGLGVYYYQLGDYLSFLTLPEQSEPWARFLTAYYAPILLFFAAAGILFWRKLDAVLLASSLIFIFVISIPLNLRQMAPYTTVESWMNYGERGMPETIDFLARQKLENKTISVRDDIFYYLQYRRLKNVQKNISTLELFSMNDIEMVRTTLNGKNFDYIVLDSVQKVYIPMQNRIGSEIAKKFHMIYRFGDFDVWRANRLKEKA